MTDLTIIENTAKAILAIVLWASIGQMLLLGAIYFKLKGLFIIAKKRNNDSNYKGNTINNGVEK